MRCTEKGFCEHCDKNRPVARQIARDLTETQRNYVYRGANFYTENKVYAETYDSEEALYALVGSVD